MVLADTMLQIRARQMDRTQQHSCERAAANEMIPLFRGRGSLPKK